MVKIVAVAARDEAQAKVCCERGVNGRGGVSPHQGTCVGTLRLRREPSELVPTMCARAWRFRKSSEYRPLWPYSGCFASTCHLSQH